MGFYNDWLNNINTYIEYDYICSFLNSTPQSLDTLLTGKKDDLLIAYQVLKNTNLEKFIDAIECDSVFASEDIVQFSNLDHAINNVCICCETESKDLTFSELGKLIMHSKQDGACKKYGENHSKLAAELSFVILIKNKSYIVKNTALGTFTIGLEKDEKEELVKKLAMRNRFIKSLIFHAKNGVISYNDLARKVLSESTCIRRKPNVKKLVSLILEDSELLNSVIW